MKIWCGSLACLLSLLTPAVPAQSSASSESGSARPQLRYIVYVSRHGVRSPTGKPAQYNPYSTAPWPEWPVQPAYLTPHGFHLMELFGAYDRELLAQQGLLTSTGCEQAAEVTFYADSDQRTRETGNALAHGLMPGCTVPVTALAEGTNDPLFHTPRDRAAKLTPALARAAIAGRMGDDPDRLTQAYRDPLMLLDHILATCGASSNGKRQRVSLFDIPATLSEGSGDHFAEMKGPINTASTLAENLLLEYSEGMDSAQVGWGCVDRDKLEWLMTLHTAATDFTNRTPAIATAQAANLLRVIRLSMQQAASGQAVAGALGRPSDRALFLIGHDTNLENIAGALNLSWIIDGRRDDTPPGSALVFELWRTGGHDTVRAYFTAQTIDQMRTSAPLSLDNPPDRVKVFLSGCGEVDMGCTLAGFLRAAQ